MTSSEKGSCKKVWGVSQPRPKSLLSKIGPGGRDYENLKSSDSLFHWQSCLATALSQQISLYQASGHVQR